MSPIPWNKIRNISDHEAVSYYLQAKLGSRRTDHDHEALGVLKVTTSVTAITMGEYLVPRILNSSSQRKIVLQKWEQLKGMERTDAWEKWREYNYTNCRIERARRRCQVIKDEFANDLPLATGNSRSESDEGSNEEESSNDEESSNEDAAPVMTQLPIPSTDSSDDDDDISSSDSDWDSFYKPQTPYVIGAKRPLSTKAIADTNDRFKKTNFAIKRELKDPRVSKV